ncbi:hypothetical protein RV11_GL003057 [Enterococcus phoeniculicola]|jgi:hypothetical protein|uniref:Uncharacterized protein n=1 Tax=Enterococcus phoeniculicola ATCC BAA-412 TaxID=1158610 RepID=R3TMJ2_9ENTE|nr:hypothetical protein [Enterococcus phoeniculicola]EOL42734.1 hypothetical protein UC3_03087 [Enterococcus phoeniculicola ATCC BAA-412]EOT78982.1 hypothetical protein I589_00489 [Enterococcus phoeniculicola ATCC BAA-412]OJG72475.1 hypothetical protein RV11_GL003057 [Enterococcus phoeniculicola]
MQFKKRKSFFYNFTWVGYLLLGLGLLFLSIGLILQIIPINESNFHMSVNGVEQPYSAANVHTFRLIFLSTFGGVGGLLLVTAGIFIGRNYYKKKRVINLKDSGEKIVAEVVDYLPSHVRVNHYPAMYLICSYKKLTGEQLNFKSKLLRRNPIPFLSDNKVIVYYDKNNLKKYFVDVDESIGNVVEL